MNSNFLARAGVAVASGALSLEASLNGALAAALAIPLQAVLPTLSQLVAELFACQLAVFC